MKHLFDDAPGPGASALDEWRAFTGIGNGLGFRAAFFDVATHAIHLSRFADGRPAPLHLLEGLPDSAITLRSAGGRPIAAKPTLIAGFERNGFFYTRSAAARAAREWAIAG